ncbi:MAG: hypothetical protein UV57_C0002G0028 [Parcubacteria group bacterium GW2011_GWD2_43_10]|uniref:Uncharacterized protein n=3 Tax=Candidatus Vebleniibacteriota TaxID=1817921 RepID=A0A1G2Q892_9BACT|nr:MAG: hypothetical protein UV47_C0019G0005 [Parcubacteria group bacterium GW2011_GWA2_42_80]KKS79036.1 MAG: hypothetical protein UV52_C0019G0005 [Parcubacteria group bacterium GW2011_GWD1_42_9]KKS84067.1 MAG: hypothetical protein UV57_C0002G0028 [Parcubacteria group bacterium GW2011_GWD2_43_10]KKS92635.1 MAG: hypothetical protein UV69_C0027G0006 [Parcubacteria group bacterium GW2011_GWE2_43_12]KKT12600.1 MAG: hypothetical protein UV92_C0025G0005 [Parcubacteria group bacterium GW2011_GWA1_43_2
MTLSSRRILYISFIAVFFIAGGIILFYLQGYRLNTDNNKLQIERTGAIQAESEPKGATINLNGEIVSDKTPATLLSLKPGDYQLGLKLAGFQSWTKTVSVAASEVTFSGEITLWPEPNSGEALGIKKINNSWLSPNGENLLYSTKPTAGNELWLLNLKSGQSRLLARQATSEIISLEWSPSSREILTQESSGKNLFWQVFDLEDNSWQYITPPEGLNFAIMHWGEGRNLIYGASANELYEFNLRTQSSKLIWRERLNDFRVYDEVIFALARQAGEGVSLKLINLSNLTTIPLEENPILSTNVKFLTGNFDWLPLFDADRHSLYLLHSPLSETKPIRTLPEVTTVSWANDQSLVITNNFEIWLYNFNDESPTFVERLSLNLSGALRYGDAPYVLFFSGNEVWALELDNRGERQRWQIGKFNNDLVGVFLSPDNKTLTVQTTQDIYRLNLQTELNSSEPPAGSPATMIQKYLHLSNSQ